MSTFDAVAGVFERDRGLPSTVPSAIRQAVVEHGDVVPDRPVLEIGCGTGRTGAAFCAAGDPYVGVDASIEMLREFQRKAFPAPPTLVQADGECLPLRTGGAGAVVLLHVLTAANWRGILAEARRVLHPTGVLVVGRSEGAADGLDARLRRRLGEILAALGGEAAPMGRDAPRQWLRTRCSRRQETAIAAWTVERTPRQFFQRKQSAARFRQIPAGLQEEALRSLASWAEQAIGPLDAPCPDTYEFRLQLYWF